MTFNDDPDLETRLRRIASDPGPDVPASVYRHLDEVAHGNGTRSINGVRLSPVRRLGGGRSGLRHAGAMAALAAVLVIAVSGAALLVATRGPQASSTWTLRPDAGQGEWTGLEWHDITATTGGVFTEPWSSSNGVGTGEVVQWRGGFAVLGGDGNLWLSKDGLAWKPAAGAPFVSYPWIAAIGGDLLIAGQANEGSGFGLWLTTDAVTWARVTAPLDVTSFSGRAGSSPGVVIVTTTPDSGDPAGPSVTYFSADASTWTQATLPADLAAARNVTVWPFGRGFVARGLVSDPNGSTTYSSGAGDERHYSERAWISHDGLSWATYNPAIPSSEVRSMPQWTMIQWGRLGAGDGLMHSIDGGSTWLADTDKIPDAMRGPLLVSDGNRIIMAAASGARFYLSEGDGHWRLLQEGGDVGSLPADGQAMLLPNGVLWITGNRVYFGQALAGVAPQGSLGPPTTPSPGPTLPYPTSTPAVMATETTVVPPTSQAPSAAPSGYTDPYHSTEVTPEQAVAVAAAFAAVPQVPVIGSAAAPTPNTSDLVASGPTDGALMRFYQVMGRDVAATVDAHDAHVASLVLGVLPAAPSTKGITSAQAVAAATSFLNARGIATDGLDMTVVAKNRGPGLDTFQVAWQRYVNGAAVPDSRQAELLASNGLVFSMVNTRRPNADPPKPVIDRDQAVAAAEKLADQSSVSSPAPGARVGPYTVVDATLGVWFTPAGVQELQWSVQLTCHTNLAYDDAYWLSVDAMTGSATVTGRG